MRVWALVSQKGGSGRSTLATQLAVYATQVGEKVVIIDTDGPQYSAHAWHELRGEGQSPAVIRAKPDRLSAVVEAMRQSGAITLVIIDTPPHTAKSALDAIRVADLVVCPIRPGMFDLRSFTETAELLQNSESVPFSVGVVNAVRTGKGAVLEYAKAAQVIERFGVRVSATYIGDRKSFQIAVETGKGVTERKPRDEAATELVALWSELNETPPIYVPVMTDEETPQ